MALGLKEETADCNYPMSMLDFRPCRRPLIGNPLEQKFDAYPAWSLHRLIEMMPNEIHKYDAWATLSVNKDYVQYEYYDIDYNHVICLEHFNDGNIYDNIYDAIEWLIKEGYFNKEYLENGNC